MTFALFILYVALNYVHPGEIVPALAPYRFAYWIGLAGLIAAIASRATRKTASVASLQLWALVVFTAVIAASLMAAERRLGAPLVAVQRFGPSLMMFVLAICSVTSLRRLRIAAAAIVALTTIVAIQGTAAYHIGYKAPMFVLDRSARTEAGLTASSESEPELDSNEPESDAAVDDDDEIDSAGGEEVEPWQPRIRGLGLMNDPNDLAMGMIVALGLIAGAWKRAPRFQHVLSGAAAGCLAYGLYLTRSRGGAVALLAMSWSFASRRIGRVPSLVLLAALAAGVMAIDFGGRSLSTTLDESASERLVAWTEGLEMLKAQPVLGIGYGQFLDHHTITAHNSLVLCFAETGLLGCFFWVGLLVVTLLELHALTGLRGSRPLDDGVRRSAEGLQLALVGFMAASFFLSRTFVPTLYLIIGLSAALAAIARCAGRAVPLPRLPELATIVLACELAGIAVIYAIVRLPLT